MNDEIERLQALLNQSNATIFGDVREIERLTAERDQARELQFQLGEELFAFQNRFGLDSAINEETCKRWDALRADALRYRWLLLRRVSENEDGEKCIYFWCDFNHFNDVDAAIDAARGEGA